MSVQIVCNQLSENSHIWGSREGSSVTVEMEYWCDREGLTAHESLEGEAGRGRFSSGPRGKELVGQVSALADTEEKSSTRCSRFPGPVTWPFVRLPLRRFFLEEIDTELQFSLGKRGYGGSGQGWGMHAVMQSSENAQSELEPETCLHLPS